MKYEEGDIVLVSSHAGPEVRVKLLSRVHVGKDEWGADGWDAKIIYKKDVDKLRKSSVPYKSGEKPVVWVFDYQILKLIRRQKK